MRLDHYPRISLAIFLSQNFSRPPKPSENYHTRVSISNLLIDITRHVLLLSLKLVKGLNTYYLYEDTFFFTLACSLLQPKYINFYKSNGQECAEIMIKSEKIHTLKSLAIYKDVCNIRRNPIEELR